MTDIIERAARAIFDARRNQAPCVAYPKIEGKWESQFSSVKERYLNEAKAVMLAIREPSETMRDAAWDSECIAPNGTPDGAWKSMIDAALSHK